MKRTGKMTIAEIAEAKKEIAIARRAMTLKKKKVAEQNAAYREKKKKINSRAKGASGEREFATYLKGRGFDARRGQQFKGGGDSPDVICGGLLARVHFEVKRVEAGNLYTWYAQACRDADLHKIPVVAHRKSNRHWVAVMDMRDVLNLMEMAYAKEETNQN